MKGIGKREWGIGIVATLIGRAVIYSMNPFAVGIFAALCLEKVPRIFFAVGILLGLYTNASWFEVIKYIIIFWGMQSALRFLEKKNFSFSGFYMGILAGGITLLVSCLANGLFGWKMEELWMAAVEFILVVVLTNIFRTGLHYILTERKGGPMDNEELISIALIFGLALYGLPMIVNYDFSVLETGAYLFLIFMGYKYGSGAGAICGTVCGLVFILKGNQFEVLGILCLLGILAGLFRQLGKIITGITFVTFYVCIGYFYETTFWEVGKVRGIVAAVVIFLCIPKRYIKKMDVSAYMQSENSFGKQNMQKITKRKLTEFASSFQRLSRTFYSIADTKEKLDIKDIDGVLGEITNKLCYQCEKSNRCLGYTRHEKYHTSHFVLSAVNSNGYVLEKDLPKDFTNKCDYVDLYLQEANRELDFAKLNLNWYNRMAESREAIADQLGEVAQIIQNFSKEIYDTKYITINKKAELIALLKRNFVEVKNIAMLEKPNHHQEIYLNARTKRGRCITTKELAVHVSTVLEKRFRPSIEAKNIVSKEFERIALVEDTNFKVLTGMARMSKEGERVSGDNFTFVELESGEMIVSLSDGMGSGLGACEESESVIELLEEFMEAGFKEESAIKLINSILVLKSTNQSFSTMDMAVINLFTGICDFIKIGASTTFIKRDDWIETIQSTSLPIGIFNHVDYDNVSKKLYDGDFIIMLSDGVLDCVKETNKEAFFEQTLSQIKTKNPKEMANCILEKAVEKNDGVAVDDMTVLVVGLWKK